MNYCVVILAVPLHLSGFGVHHEVLLSACTQNRTPGWLLGLALGDRALRSSHPNIVAPISSFDSKSI